LVGFKNQMSHLYGKNYLYFQKMLLGSGRNPDIKQEGIRYHHFIGTYLLGPILPLNPYFTKSIIEMLGVKKVSLAFEEMALLAYQTRLKEFKEMIK